MCGVYWLDEKDAKSAFGGRSDRWGWNSGDKGFPDPEVSRIQGWKSDF